VAQKLSDFDRKVFAAKQVLRAKDRQAVSSGQRTWGEMNRTNAFGASIASLYRPVRKLDRAR
jgi:hypothetical protein